MGFLYGFLCGVPGAMGLLGAGIYLTARLRGVQVRAFPSAVKAVFSSRDTCGCGEISCVQSLCTALAGTMGTGNIAGVAGAIALGGPGAIFWMWAAAFFGMAVKYAEVYLAACFRSRNEAGERVGGPMYYMEKGLGNKKLAKAFCICGVLASFGIGNAVQVNTLSGSICTLAEALEFGVSERTLRLSMGGALSCLTFLVLFGGMRRIACTAERLIPFVSTVYILSMLCVIAVHYKAVLPALGDILSGAFSPRSVLGGAAGISLRHTLGAGVTRGVFTHEAGMGSSAMAHAAAQGTEPHAQGLWGIMEVFIDTMVICTLTALGILTSGCPVPYGQNAGAEVTTGALSTVFGMRGSAFVIFLCLACFAVSTLMAWSFYGLRCVEYLGGKRGKKAYLAAFSLSVIPFSAVSAGKVWKASEIVCVLMALVNVPSVITLLKSKKEVAQWGARGYTGR